MLFTQVGVMNLNGSTQWFAYSELGDTHEPICVRGSPYWPDKYGPNYLGCLGSPGDLGVSATAWTEAEFTYLPLPAGPGTVGQWAASIYDQNGVRYTVAEFGTSSPLSSVIKPYVSAEMGTIAQPSNPWYRMEFWYYHPQYLAGAGMQDWPASSAGETNELTAVTYTPGEVVCPDHYGGWPGLAYDVRQWGATWSTVSAYCDFFPF
jgi:hypothetical protein